MLVLFRFTFYLNFRLEIIDFLNKETKIPYHLKRRHSSVFVSVYSRKSLFLFLAVHAEVQTNREVISYHCMPLQAIPVNQHRLCFVYPGTLGGKLVLNSEIRRNLSKNKSWNCIFRNCTCCGYKSSFCSFCLVQCLSRFVT